MPEHTDSAGGDYEKCPLALGGCFRYRSPKFTKDMIYFNGSHGLGREKSDDGWCDKIVESSIEGIDNLDHETFSISRKYVKSTHSFQPPKDTLMFNCCKTARKPYDLMVCACLLVAKYYFADGLSISSNGDLDDWMPAISFVGKYLPHVKCVLTEELLGNDFMKWLELIA